MDAFLSDPVIQSSAVPLVLGLILSGVIGLTGRHRLAVLGIPLAFLIMQGWLAGIPGIPPQGSTAKLFWCVAIGAGVAALADSFRPPAWLSGGLILAWLAGSLWWLVGGSLSTTRDMITLAVLALLALWIAFGQREGSGNSVVLAGAVPLAWALALGVSTLIGASSGLVTQLCLALGAIIGGLLLLNWPWERHEWGVSGQVTLGIALLLTTITTFFTSLNSLYLLVALPSLVAGRLYHRMPFNRSGLGRAVAVALTTIIILIPAAAAIAVTYVLTGGDASPY